MHSSDGDGTNDALRRSATDREIADFSPILDTLATYYADKRVVSRFSPLISLLKRG